MRHILSLALALVMLTLLASAAPDTANVTTQIVEMPLGANIEVRLKNKQKLRGARGAVSASGFTLVDTRTGERQIAFDDVVSVKKQTTNSHTTRNVLIGVGIGAVAALAAIILYAVHDWHSR